MALSRICQLVASATRLLADYALELSWRKFRKNSTEQPTDQTSQAAQAFLSDFL